ncbi:MAG: 3-phosphoshikimate 1-carboxyvinyltransferase [Gemmatimonadetes bacterium]|nr:3-phosphoshikimate 1-carboxyvinyltransferase [Gemmatimonadota bacterium]
MRATAACLRAMGVAMPELAPDLRIEGVGLRGLRQPTVALDAANSGTTARLLAGVIAGHPMTATLVGDASLSRRPMRRIAAPLAAMGARVALTEQGTLPMTITGGPLAPVDWTSDTASAQVKSCVLLAGVVAGVPVSVREPARSRDHTERLLRTTAVGAELVQDDTLVRIGRVDHLQPLDVVVPGDPSSAAFFAALAAAVPGSEVVLTNVCLNPTRTGFFNTLQRMGVEVELLDRREVGGEPVGTLRVRPRGLAGRTVAGAMIPTMIDELPLLACLAALADGETTIRDAHELRAKESDRIAAVVANLRALGADAEERPDGLVIRGGRGALHGGAVTTHGDHRLAMAFGVLGAATGLDVRIDDPACVDVSYPGFWRDLAQLTR